MKLPRSGLQQSVETTSTYDVEQRLVELRRLSTQQSGAGINKREYYRYDALGRRIWRRTLNGWGPSGTVRDSLCTRPTPSSDCNSFVERVVWDGDQVLYEIRASAEPGSPASVLEANNHLAPFFGRVVYTHGGGIDRPLEIVREGNIVTVPHGDWRGSYDMLTYADSSMHRTCGPSVGYPIGVECHPIDLPSVTAYLEFGHKHPNGTETGPRSWWGNLVNGQLDASGLLYRRNRYYDPKQGRFTQEDPIGLAGGLNLYGYANGDPVNFSDPFGLTPCGPFTIACYRAAAFVLGRALPAVGSLGRAALRFATPGPDLTPDAGAGVRFAQRGISSTFRHGEFAGRSIDDVAAGLRSSAISPDQLPINVITRDGVAYTLNNRSLMALRRAGLQPTVINDVTGNATLEKVLTQRLAEIGELGEGFVPVIRR